MSRSLSRRVFRRRRRREEEDDESEELDVAAEDVAAIDQQIYHKLQRGYINHLKIKTKITQKSKESIQLNTNSVQTKQIKSVSILVINLTSNLYRCQVSFPMTQIVGSTTSKHSKIQNETAKNQNETLNRAGDSEITPKKRRRGKA